MHIRDIVQGTHKTASRRFELASIALILSSIVALAFGTLPDLEPETHAFLGTFQSAITVIFTIEYGLRVAFASNRAKFIFSFYGIVDVVAVLPFYLALGSDFQALRAIRIVRIFSLTRYESAITRVRKALVLARDEAVLFLVVTLILLFLSAVGIYHFEHEAQPDQFRSVFDGLWWAVATLTTVGYGDIYPITPAGRFFTAIVVICGLGVIAVPAGLIAAALTTVRQEEQDKK